MKKSELIKILTQYPDDFEVMLYYFKEPRPLSPEAISVHTVVKTQSKGTIGKWEEWHIVKGSKFPGEVERKDAIVIG